MIELDRALALDRRSIQMLPQGGEPGGHGIPGSSASARWALDPDNVEHRRLTNQDGPSIERYPYIYPLGYIRGARRGPLGSWSGRTMMEVGGREDGEGGKVGRRRNYVEGSSDVRPKRTRVGREERRDEDGWVTFEEEQPTLGELVRVWLYPHVGRARVAKLVKERIGPCWQFGEGKPMRVVAQDRWKEL